VFRIGEFSRLARVSCRLLRYYDELGLLAPERVDDTGYRFYSAGQLPRLNRILVLRDLGFSLDEIARILTEELSAKELRAMLLVRRADLVRVVDAESERLRHVEARIAQIDAEGELTSDDVVLRSEPAVRIVSVRRVLPSFVAVRELFGVIVPAVRAQAPAGALGAAIGIAHNQEFELDQLDIEIGFALSGKLRSTIRLPGGDALEERELPAVERMAACVRIGLPERAHLVTGRIGKFVEANGYRLAGPGREVFLAPPRLEAMETSVVEMQFPLEKASRP
jgi:DNA-binding transcriptional MerR regulator